MASEAVLKYLVDTNRPYSCADVTVNLRGAYSKGVVQKTLDALSEAGKIKCKLYGKQKVYAAIQTDIVDDADDKEDYDSRIKILTQSLLEKGNQLKITENNLKVLTLAPTTPGAKLQIDDIDKKIKAMEDKVNILRTSAEVVSAEEKKFILNEHDKVLKEYRKRKRITSDILEAILEGYPKSKKNLLEELCIETDEMVGFKLLS